MIFRKKAAEKLFRFDMIRFLKLAEIIQYSVIAFVFALLIGTFVNKHMPSTLDDDKKPKNILIISLETIIHISILIIVAYYLKKFVWNSISWKGCNIACYYSLWVPTKCK